MIDVLSAAGSNFLSPTILAFVLGALAGFFRSDLEVPEAIAKGLEALLQGRVQVADSLKFTFMEAVLLQDAGLVDIEGADVIVQAFCFGEIVFG